MSTSHSFISIVHSYHHPHHNASYFVIILHRIRAEEENTSHKIMIKHLPWYQTLEIKFPSIYMFVKSGRLGAWTCKFHTLSIFYNWWSNFLAGVQFSGQWARPLLPNCRIADPQRAPEADLASNQLNSAPNALSQRGHHAPQRTSAYTQLEKCPRSTEADETDGD